MGVNFKKLAKKIDGSKHILIMMRHAKAESFSAQGDRDRELTDKGLKQAKIVGRGLTELGLVPDRIAVSGATRAQQTLERMLKLFGDKPSVDNRQSLYDGGVQAVLDELTHTPDKARVLMILGHEPTMSVSCQWLASSDSDPERLDLLTLGMSTAGVAIFGSDKPFNQWQVHSGTLLAVLNVKDFD
ncbi:SixA phosphatase family protein [Bifidobacterium avesanii]|uniref:Phosphoglycerate mutase n=1 Tax=Bifidobacterium avesanii TaxID=1798157 RepID=A0A7K3TGI9_9BIFI|nr:histidine phosphatase family protein [Bifidobacterium avesanii]KAB8293657.1 phosphoglycerate mutase [Bifidobacterium avesanii]NEG78208.1 phosphoglycerate mutase [Bifidobacterium avesanii]